MPTLPSDILQRYPSNGKTNDHVIRWALDHGRIAVDCTTGVVRIADRFPALTHDASYVGKRGYITFDISCPWGRRALYVHRIVCAVSHGYAPTPLHVVNHKNGVKTDNRPENLEWVTTAENIRHSFATGIHRPRRGSETHKAIISEEDVMAIRTMHSLGATPLELSSEYGLKAEYIGSVIAGRTWGHLPLVPDTPGGKARRASRARFKALVVAGNALAALVRGAK